MTRDREGDRVRQTGHVPRGMAVPRRVWRGVGAGAGKPLSPCRPPRRRPGPDAGPEPLAGAKNFSERIRQRKRRSPLSASIGTVGAGRVGAAVRCPCGYGAEKRHEGLTLVGTFSKPN